MNIWSLKEVLISTSTGIKVEHFPSKNKRNIDNYYVNYVTIYIITLFRIVSIFLHTTFSAQNFSLLFIVQLARNLKDGQLNIKKILPL